MIKISDEWVTSVSLLGDKESFALWAAIQRGFLSCHRPTDLLVQTYGVMCALEEKTCVILFRRPSCLCKIVVCVPHLTWLPRLLERFAESDALIHRIRPELGQVIALVSEDCAESVARTVASWRIKSNSGNGVSQG